MVASLTTTCSSHLLLLVQGSLATVFGTDANFDFVLVAFSDDLRVAGYCSCGAVKCIIRLLETTIAFALGSCLNMHA